MEIKVAKYAGFCFGVDKAVKTSFELNYDGNKYTMGELIHNRNVIEQLEKKGIKAINNLDGLKEGDCVIIRAHGIGEKLYNDLKSLNVRILDATCPYVKRIHEIVKKSTKLEIKL